MKAPEVEKEQLHSAVAIASTGLVCLLLQWCSLLTHGTGNTFLELVGLGLELPFWLFGGAGLALLELVNLALLGGRFSIEFPPSPWLSAWVGVSLWKIAVVNIGQLMGSMGIYWAVGRLFRQRLTAQAGMKVALVLCAASLWTWLYWVSRIRHVGERVMTSSLLVQGSFLRLGKRSLPESLLTSDQDYSHFYIDSVLLTLLSGAILYLVAVLLGVFMKRWHKDTEPNVARAVRAP